MFEGLDRLDWAAMTHAYGSAEDVPDLLRQLVSNDPEEREFGLDGLYGAVHHQGDIYDCTIACIPFLLEAVANPNVPDRGEILDLLASIGGADTPSFESHQDEENHADPEQGSQNGRIAHEAVLDKHDMFLALLGDPDPAVRQKAPKVLCACWEQAASIVPAMQDRLSNETDQQSRIQLIEAIGALANRGAKGQTGKVDGDAIGTWLVERLAEDADPAVRLSAVVQIARAYPARLPSNVVTTVFAILQASSGDASPAAGEPGGSDANSERVASESAPVPTTNTHLGMLRQLRNTVNEGRYAPWVGDLLHQLHGALGDRVQERLQLITALLRAPHWEWRLDGVHSAGALMGGWRGQYTELVALLGEQLVDPSSQVCGHAILALTHRELGRLAAPAADALARYLEASPRESGPLLSSYRSPGWIEVLDAGTGGILGPVLKALAALRDPRSVPPLRWVLEREMLAVDTGWVLASMGPDAAQFIPAMVRWLRSRPIVKPGWDDHRTGLVYALGGLGPAAAPAVTDLVTLLANERIAMSAARTLGLIGPQAAVAVPTLNDLLSSSDASIAIAAALALYRINGDTSRTLLTLKRHLIQGSRNNVQAADCCAELGATAESLVPQLLDLLTDPLPIVRVRAAGALWAVTSDVAASLPVLLADWEDCPHVRLHAARCIVQMGSAVQSAIPFLQGEIARVRRHTYNPNGSGSRDIVDDEALLEACARAITRIMGEETIAPGQ